MSKKVTPIMITRSKEILKVSKSGVATTSTLFVGRFFDGHERTIRVVAKYPVGVLKMHEFGAMGTSMMGSLDCPLFFQDWSKHPVTHTPSPKFKVTREFTGGILNGQTFTEISGIQFEVGFNCSNPVGNGSPYIITACDRV